MTLSSAENTVCFGLFELDLRTGQLTKNGAKVRLPQQPTQVLSLLLDHPGEIVTREEFRRRLWPSDVFVDFDHGLNKSIQKLRDALGDSAGSPRFIETIPRVGYRFIAPVKRESTTSEGKSDSITSPPQNVTAASIATKIEESRRVRRVSITSRVLGVAACVVLAFAGMALYRFRHRPAEVTYTQLTDFTDSAVAPALSPDGHMLAFIRGSNSFLSSDQIYVKMLPNGEARRVTDDNRPKYGLAFSPDGSQIAYTALEGSTFSTYEVSALGGEPRLFLKNAAGLVWLGAQRLLFSEVDSGIHMGVVTATVTGAGRHEVYFPAHERGMAHYSFPSPDHRWALVVEMNGNGEWAPCRLVPLAPQGSSRLTGPKGPCTAAGWSPDGNWMYFTAWIKGQSHIWRQHFPEGQPEQITSGPTDEDGLAVDPDQRALITSVGVQESAIWIHDGKDERPLSSEGEVLGETSPPVFNPDATVLYYLLRRAAASGPELWRSIVNSGNSEAVFPGISMTAFDLSQDGNQVVFTTAGPDGTTQLWLAPLDHSLPPTKIGISGARSPHFGVHGQILFQKAEGNLNYLEQINPDGSNLSKVFQFPILEFQGVSPGRRWVTVAIPRTPDTNFAVVAIIPLNGGIPRRLCENYCRPRWSPDGRFLYVPVEEQSRTSAGRSLAIPIGLGETLPNFPVEGLGPTAQADVVPGAESVGRAELVPGKDRDHYAWVNTTVHRNLFRILVP